MPSYDQGSLSWDSAGFHSLSAVSGPMEAPHIDYSMNPLWKPSASPRVPSQHLSPSAQAVVQRTVAPSSQTIFTNPVQDMNWIRPSHRSISYGGHDPRTYSPHHNQAFNEGLRRASTVSQMHFAQSDTSSTATASEGASLPVPTTAPSGHTASPYDFQHTWSPYGGQEQQHFSDPKTFEDNSYDPQWY